MSHAQTPAVQLFWGMHGLVLETSIWLLAESTRSQLYSKHLFFKKKWFFFKRFKYFRKSFWRSKFENFVFFLISRKRKRKSKKNEFFLVFVFVFSFHSQISVLWPLLKLSEFFKMQISKNNPKRRVSLLEHQIQKKKGFFFCVCLLDQNCILLRLCSMLVF